MKNTITDQFKALEDGMEALRSRIEPHLPVLDVLDGNVSRKKKGSPARRSQWQQQGKYLAAIRTLPKIDRVKVKRTLKKDGYAAAIKTAKALAAASPRRRSSVVRPQQG